MVLPVEPIRREAEGAGMNEGLLTAGMVGFFTLAGSLGSAYLAHWFQERREQEQERKEHKRWIRDERKRAYGSLLEAARKLLDAALGRDPQRYDRQITEINKFLTELSIFAESEQADRLDELGVKVLESTDETRIEAVMRFHGAIWAAARKDLGIESSNL